MYKDELKAGDEEDMPSVSTNATLSTEWSFFPGMQHIPPTLFKVVVVTSIFNNLRTCNAREQVHPTLLSRTSPFPLSSPSSRKRSRCTTPNDTSPSTTWTSKLSPSIPLLSSSPPCSASSGRSQPCHGLLILTRTSNGRRCAHPILSCFSSSHPYKFKEGKLMPLSSIALVPNHIALSPYFPLLTQSLPVLPSSSKLHPSTCPFTSPSTKSTAENTLSPCWPTTPPSATPKS
jgi:hypothetical protein